MKSSGITTIGEPHPRVDGPAKVTGTARYAAETELPGLLYGSLVMSAIPSGRVLRLDVAEAERASGVVAVITPRNALKLPGAERRLTLLQDDQVFYQNQPIALVVAETFHEAQYGASLVRAEYEKTVAKLDFEAGFPASYTYTHNGEPGD